MDLRIRRADGAPGLGAVELFAKCPESAVADPELESEALRLLAAIDLDIVKNGGRVSLATNRELARLCGRCARNPLSNDRWVCRWLKRLVARGQISIEAIGSIAGSPRGIRPLAQLKGRKCTQTEVSGCTTTELSGRADSFVGAPRRESRGAPTVLSVPLIREEREEENSRVAGLVGSVASDLPTPTTGRAEGDRPPADHPPMQNYNPPLKAEPLAPDEELTPEFLAEFRAKLGLPTRARKNPGDRTAKSVPGAASRNSVPDVPDSTGEPSQESRPVPANGNITPNI